MSIASGTSIVGRLISYSQAVSGGSTSTNTTANGPVTLTAAQMLSGFIDCNGAQGGGFNYVTDTAAAILTAMQALVLGAGATSGITVGQKFTFTIFNDGTGQTGTLTGGTNVTISAPTTTVATTAARTFTYIVTAVGATPTGRVVGA